MRLRQAWAVLDALRAHGAERLGREWFDAVAGSDEEADDLAAAASRPGPDWNPFR